MGDRAENTDRKKISFIFDLDGTLYLGDQIIPGAKEAVDSVREKGMSVRFVTNNPRYSQSYYAQKLSKLGIPAHVNEVVTSGMVTAEFLKDKTEFGSLLVIGEEQLYKELRDKGLEVVEKSDADTVIVSFDTHLTYEKLMKAYRALLNGARFIATNPDPVCPSPDGGLIDAGSIIAALEKATGRHVEMILGKPSKLLGKWLIDQLGGVPENCVIVGDRLNTDIRLGKTVGMRAVWINTKKEKVPHLLYHPDYVIESISHLPKVIDDLIKRS